MTTIQLLHLYITKLHHWSNWDPEFQIECGITEIELKKCSPFGFDSLVEVSGTIENVVGQYTLKFLSKGVKTLVEAHFWLHIIFCIAYTLPLLCKLVFSACSLGVFKILPKSGKYSLPPPEDQQCFHSNLEWHLFNRCRRHK